MERFAYIFEAEAYLKLSINYVIYLGVEVLLVLDFVDHALHKV